MAKKTLSMRQIQEILRLKYQNKLTIREVAGSCGLPASTVGDYLKRAEVAGISWPLPEGLDEKQLLERLMAAAPPETDSCASMPDWPYIHKELGRKSVTLTLLWKEYHQTHPEGYAYSRFCQLYQIWSDKLDPVLRQRHEPGEKMFVDWAGQTVPIHNAQDGSVSAAHVFVAVLGASNKTYAQAFENEQLPAWIAAHCHAYAFFNGVAKVTVPDNPQRHLGSHLIIQHFKRGNNPCDERRTKILRTIPDTGLKSLRTRFRYCNRIGHTERRVWFKG